VAEDFAFSPDELPEDRSLILVDDDRAFVLRLARAMETRGFEVRVAHSVAEGMDLIRQKAPAFAIVDMRLEDGNGLDVIAELAKIRSDARTIVLTGYGNIATAVTAVKLGAVDYLAKPADADEVTDALLLFQVVYVRRRLDRRALQISAGEDAPPSLLHVVYIALEAAKLVLLPIIGTGLAWRWIA